MTFEEYWNKHWADALTETADYTFGEEVWNAAKGDDRQDDKDDI